MSTLVLLRHGQSQWNLENRFTGWVDIPLSPKGRQEALDAGQKIADIKFDIAYTSTLVRAIETLSLSYSQNRSGKTPIFNHTDGKQKSWSHHTENPEKELPVISDEALNERYYGDLQGLNKDEARKKWGEEQVHIWRRSFATPPPNGESLKNTLERTLPFFSKYILEDLKQGKNVLIAAHGNSLRSIAKHLENISDQEIPKLEIPTGQPWVYEIDEKGSVISKRIL